VTLTASPQPSNLFQVRSVSFFDALALSAALAARCVEFLSEDLNSGEQISGLTFTNPFVAK
jgi:predicted nucleic acid-binding protein